MNLGQEVLWEYLEKGGGDDSDNNNGDYDDDDDSGDMVLDTLRMLAARCVTEIIDDGRRSLCKPTQVQLDGGDSHVVHVLAFKRQTAQLLAKCDQSFSS